jgi:hypothetical protein
MATNYRFITFSPGQQRIYNGAVHLYAAYLEALRATRPFRGGMHWKKIKGRQYLYQYVDRYGHGRSLGPRAGTTEELLAEFNRARQAAAARLRDLRPQLTEQARFCRAALLHRVPRTVVRVLRQLEQHEVLKENVMVIGGNAIHAFEFAAGVFLESSETLDLLAISGGSLTLATHRQAPPAELLALLRKADRSFVASGGQGFRAVNRGGYLVQILSPGPQTTGVRGGAAETMGGAGGNLHYLLSSPKFSQVVIGKDGAPATMVVPDPRAFALHQLWLSEQAGREESQQARDLGLAMAVAQLVLGYLPQYHFFHADLRRFPDEVVRRAADLAAESDLATGLDVEY